MQLIQSTHGLIAENQAYTLNAFRARLFVTKQDALNHISNFGLHASVVPADDAAYVFYLLCAKAHYYSRHYLHTQHQRDLELSHQADLLAQAVRHLRGDTEQVIAALPPNSYSSILAAELALKKHRSDYQHLLDF